MKKYVEIEFRKGDSQFKERRIFRNVTHADLEGKLIVIRNEDNELFVLNIEADCLIWLSVEKEPEPSVEDMDNELLQIAISGRLIGAIKRCRELTNRGLKEAKDYVEKLVSDYQKKNSRDSFNV